jgi:hypothetical protein
MYENTSWYSLVTNILMTHIWSTETVIRVKIYFYYAWTSFMKIYLIFLSSLKYYYSKSELTIAGLTLLSLERSTRPFAYIWELQFVDFFPPFHIGKIGLLYLNCLYKQNDLWYIRQREFMWCALDKKPGLLGSSKLLWWTILWKHTHNPMLEELSSSCAARLGEDPWKLVPGSFQTLPQVPFPFIDFLLCIFPL